MLNRKSKKLIEYQTEITEKHLDEIRGMYKEMRGYKHDFHHHLQVLRSQLELGNTERALTYIDELDRELSEVNTFIKTGNVALDVILSCKIAQAKAKGITVTIKANVPDKLSLTDVELSIIVGNLMDNATEACMKVEGDRFMRIYITMKKSMLYFSLLNSAAGKQNKIGGLFSTSKSGSFHGLGLYRAESIIKKHGGWCKYNSEDGAFTSEFLVKAEE